MDKKEKRDFKTLKIRVSESENQEIEKRKPENLSMADWLRGLAMGEEIQIKRERRPVPVADPKLIMHWGKIGGNINQIARALNESNKIGEPVSLVQILGVLTSIESKIKNQTILSISQRAKVAKE